MGTSETIAMIDGMIGLMIAEVADEMIIVLTATAAMITATTEEMIGVNLMRIAETLPRVSRLRLPLRAKERGTTIEMITRR